MRDNNFIIIFGGKNMPAMFMRHASSTLTATSWPSRDHGKRVKDTMHTTPTQLLGQGE